jgi:hypothetical protein
MRAKEFIVEKLNRNGSNELVIFDIDDTLLHTTAKINVIKDGKVIRSLSNQEFNNYKLQPGEEFDFGEFRNAEKFEKESVPIGPMLDQLRSDLAAGHDVVMLTARADFDNQKAVWRTFKRHGIDINSDVHLYRAGNLPGSDAPAHKKAIHVTTWLKTGRYNKVTMYDDSEKNLSVFKSLQKHFPDVKFAAHHVSETGDTKQLEAWSQKYKRSINCSDPKGFSQRAHCQGRKKEEDYHPNDRPPGPRTKPTMPPGTVKVDVSDTYDWYKLGMHISDLAGLGKHDFGKGPPNTIMAFGSEEEEHKYIQDLLKTGLTTTDIDPVDPKQPKGMRKQKVDPTYNVGENFADGRNPQDKGDSKRHGVPTKASVSTLRKVAKQGGRKGQLAHWMANMKAGKAKKK